MNHEKGAWYYQRSEQIVVECRAVYGSTLRDALGIP